MWAMWGTWGMMGKTGYTGTLVTQVHGVCGLQGYSNHAVFFLSVSHTIFGCVHKNVKICQIEKMADYPNEREVYIHCFYCNYDI